MCQLDNFTRSERLIQSRFNNNGISRAQYLFCILFSFSKEELNRQVNELKDELKAKDDAVQEMNSKMEELRVSD